MKKRICIILLSILSMKLAAQQEGHYTQFMYNKLLLNPAYSGVRNVPNFTAIHRSQWVGFDGAPTSQLLSFNAPFLSKRVGIGATISHATIGFERDFFGSLAYSYDLLAKDGLSLRLGVQGSIRSFRLFFDPTKVVQSSFPGQDANLSSQPIQKTIGNFGLGIYGQYKDIFYAGISSPQLVANGLNDLNASVPAANLATVKKHIYGMLGVSLPVADKVRLLPQALIKYVKNAPLDADFNLSLEYDKRLGTGLSLRAGGDNPFESADLMVFFKVKNQFTIGASYDFTLSQIKDYSSGSFEIMLSADLKATKNEMTNPRFFF